MIRPIIFAILSGLLVGGFLYKTPDLIGPDVVIGFIVWLFSNLIFLDGYLNKRGP